MTDKTQKNETTDYPDYRVYHVPEEKNAFWTRIGAAWNHKDNEGLNIELDLIPYRTGRIVLRKLDLEKEKERKQAPENQE